MVETPTRDVLKIEALRLNPNTGKFILLLDKEFRDLTIPKEAGQPRNIIIRAKIDGLNPERESKIDEFAESLGALTESPWERVNHGNRYHTKYSQRTFIFPIQKVK